MTSFKKFEELAWEEKASRYFDTWGSVTAQAIPAIINAARITADSRLLDCGCGPGHFCKAASEIGAKVTGSDYSEAMLAIARKNFPLIHFVREDAERLSFSESSFDVVVLNYLLLHVADQGRALLEARRVLSANGRLVFSLWLAPAKSPGLGLMFQAIKKFADMSVIPPAQDIFSFSDAEYSKTFLAANGFKDIQIEEFPTHWKVSDGESFFRAVQAGTRMGGLIDLQQAGPKLQIKNEILQHIEVFRSGNSYVVPTPTIIVSAQKA